MPDTYIQLALRPFPTLRNVYIESANIYTVHLPQQQIKEEWDLKKKNLDAAAHVSENISKGFTIGPSEFRRWSYPLINAISFMIKLSYD
jgi:hypothetical protein